MQSFVNTCLSSVVEAPGTMVRTNAAGVPKATFDLQLQHKSKSKRIYLSLHKMLQSQTVLLHPHCMQITYTSRGTTFQSGEFPCGWQLKHARAILKSAKKVIKVNRS